MTADELRALIDCLTVGDADKARARMDAASQELGTNLHELGAAGFETRVEVGASTYLVQVRLIKQERKQ